MRRPGLLTYLFGNSLVALVAMLFAIFVVYQWWFNGAPGLLALVVCFVAGGAAQANERLDSYFAWKRDWEAMAGERPTAGRAFVSHRACRVAAGLFAWAVYAILTYRVSGDPDMQFAVYWFYLVTAVMGVGVAVEWRRKHPRRRKPKELSAVALCADAKAKSQPLAKAFAALPDYCGTLLRRPG
jgi:hypothetical protein